MNKKFVINYEMKKTRSRKSSGDSVYINKLITYCAALVKRKTVIHIYTIYVHLHVLINTNTIQQ